ncbi:MAG: hypothetical protein F8N39_10495 [Clostridiaceae bacterium]|nr:hypothetical protein [Clostridiaceae bacterium]
MHILKNGLNSSARTIEKTAIPPVLSEPLKINLLIIDKKMDVLNIKSKTSTVNISRYEEEDDIFKNHLIFNPW